MKKKVTRVGGAGKGSGDAKHRLKAAQERRAKRGVTHRWLSPHRSQTHE
jgi:hypothetical protein